MIIGTDRSLLQKKLDEPSTVLLLLCGSEMSVARSVLELATDSTDVQWRRVLLITDPSILTSKEVESWGLSDGTFVALDMTRNVIEKGPVSELTYQLRIDEVFRRAETQSRS